MKSNFDCIIIGAGPAGLSAALYLKQAGQNIKIIDKNAPGGQLLKTNLIDNYLGIPNINGADLALKMVEHINSLNIQIEYEEVTNIQKDKENYLIKCKNKELKTKYIIIATGKTPNKLKISTDKVKGISYCAICDGMLYKNKIVAVVGAGDKAYTESLYLSNICKKIYIIVRNKAKAKQELIDKVNKTNNIEILKQKEIAEIITDNNIITKIKLNNQEIINIDGLFISIGGKPNLNFIKNIEKEEEYIKVNENLETSMPNIYAVGDVRKKKYYQIISAINDGMTAALNIKERIRNETN